MAGLTNLFPQLVSNNFNDLILQIAVFFSLYGLIPTHIYAIQMWWTLMVSNSEEQKLPPYTKLEG